MIRALCITGPTASGKTRLSLEVAKMLDGEIISLDSMQIYKEMDIGTAKATEKERAVAPHHMIDIVAPSERYSQEDYRADALAVAEDISKRGRLPIFVGGTGLYYDALLRGGELESPPSSEELTDKLIEEGKTDEGRARLWERLRRVDPDSAEKIHPNNLRRLVRALEVYMLTGRTKTYFDSLTKRESDRIKIGLIALDFHNRENLYERVNRRVDLMMKEGLLEEVRSLYERGLLAPEYTASQAIGYKEFIDYIEGRTTLSEAVELLKMSSRRYAKRQLTWWRHHPGRVTVYLDREDGVMKSEEEFIAEATETSRRVYLEIKRD